MNDIKVKAFGLIYLTKRQYLLIQGLVLLSLFIALSISLVFGFPTSESFILRNLGIGSLIIIVLEIIEAIFMLKKFKDKAQ